MDIQERSAFWKVKYDADSRKFKAISIASIGAVLVAASFFDSLLPATVLLIGVGTEAVVRQPSVNADKELPEPSLELVEEKYRLKAVGEKAVDAVVFISQYREQESIKQERFE